MAISDLEVFETHPDPMWICDDDTLKIRAANAAAAAAYGYPVSAFVDMSMHDLDAAAGDAGGLEEARQLPFVDTVHRRSDGSFVPVALHARRFPGADPGAVLYEARDVSRLVALEQDNRSLSLAGKLWETLDNIGDGLFMVDADWRLTFVNHETQRVLQRAASSLLGLHLSDAAEQTFGTDFTGQCRQALQTGRAASFEVYSESAAGWFDVRVYPSDAGLVVYFRDISVERRQREQLMLLETAVSRLNDTIMITGADPLDPPGPPIIFVNDAFVKQTGYSAEYALGNNPRLLQGPRTDRDRLNRIRAALEAGRSERVSLVNYRSDGTPFHVEFDVAPILGDDGRPTHFVSVQRDVTERVQAEQELTAARDRLRESEERFRLVAQATADVVWDWDLQADTLWRSSGGEVLFGDSPYDPAQYLSVWQERMHPDDRERVIDGLYAAIAGSDEWWEEYRFRRADGGWANIRDRGSVIRDETGTALRMVGSMNDVTAQRELEEKLQRSQRLDAVGQLTGGVAHDFNNLLTVVLGNADLLVDQLADQAHLQTLAAMTRSAAERGAELTRRLLAFARRQALDPAATDVNVLLRGMYDLLHRTLGEHIHIELHPDDGLWQAMVDAPQLESAVLNLCLNARDAMPGGGRLTLRTGNVRLADDDHIHAGEIVAGDYVTITVSDTGSGMPPEVIAHVFEPFFTTKDTGEGSGLGLSMVYGFIKQSAGHVRIDSQPGQGSAITLYLPRAQAPSEQPARPRERQPVVGGSERVLLVEDDDIVRTFARRQLEELGYAVVSVANGQQAIAELAGGAPFDLLFTDVVMPGGMNGRGAVESPLLSKPYRRAELATKVRQALGRG